ncbi:MAG: YbjN domain-containing protein [Hyphomicrobiaceae bacterium]
MISRISARDVENLLREMNIEFKEVDTDVYQLQLSGLKVLFFNKGEDVQLYAGFTLDQKPTLTRINEWNRDKRFSRAYIDKEGDPVIEADLDAAGGVTRLGLRKFIELFQFSMEQFTKHIN